MPQFVAPMQASSLKEPFQHPGIVRLDYVERYQRGVSVSPCPPIRQRAPLVDCGDGETLTSEEPNSWGLYPAANGDSPSFDGSIFAAHKNHAMGSRTHLPFPIRQPGKVKL